MNDYIPLSDLEICNAIFELEKPEYRDKMIEDGIIFLGDSTNWTEYNPLAENNSLLIPLMHKYKLTVECKPNGGATVSTKQVSIYHPMLAHAVCLAIIELS